MSPTLRSLGLFLWALVSLAGLSGCASDPRYSQGVEWIVSDAAQKKQLNDAGFPQYIGSSR